MTIAHRTGVSFTSRKRRLLQCGTALPLLLAAWPVLAAPIVESSSSDISVDADSATGSPVAVDLSTDGGAIDVSVDAVTATGAASGYSNAVTLRTVGGAIVATFGSVTTTSADEVFGVGAQSQGGDVSLTTGSVVTDGASGGGILVVTESGDINIDAGTTRVENAGYSGDYTGDAVTAVSGTGNVSIISDNAFSAALYGSAVVGVSEGDVTIVSGVAETSGDSGVAVSGRATNGTVSITADRIVTSGAGSNALEAASTGGSIAIDAGTITATGENASGIFARVGAGGATIDVGSVTTTASAISLRANGQAPGTATIDIAGDVEAATRGIDIFLASETFSPQSLWTTINIAEGASVTGATGVELGATVNSGMTPPPALLSGIVVINNDGAITGSSGTALALGQTVGTITNRGTIDGDIVIGTGSVQNRGGIIDGSVTLNTTPGGAISMFAYEGDDTGVTGAITGSAAIDTFGQIFAADGTARIGGGLPTAFERYGVVTDNSETTVIVETAANPVGATPSLLLMGEGAIVNRADLSGAVVAGAPGAPVQIVPAVSSYGFTTSATPWGPRFSFEGAGIGPVSFTNEADIVGRVVLSTSEFVNSGSITRSSAGVPSIVTARLGEAFSFTNTGAISMTDNGNRARVAPDMAGNPFVDPNPYFLPETAMTVRSAVSGTLDGDGLYVPATIVNSGDIDGGFLARMTASEFAFDNSGTISGFNGDTRRELGLTILLGRNYDAGIGDTMYYEPAPTLASETATFTNSGEIADGVYAHFIADVVSFSNTGLIAGNDVDPDALFVEQSLENDTDAESFAFVNSGEIAGNVGLEIEVSTATIANEGEITGAEYAVNQMTFPELVFGGESAFEIDNETTGDSNLTFTNTGTIATTAHAGSAVTIEIEAGEDDGSGEGIGNAHVAVVNGGTIAATGGATIVPQQFATWLEPGQILVNPMAALAVDATDVNGASVVTIENQAGGVIRAGGALQVTTPGGYVPATDAPADLYTVAIYATGKTIEITNSGTIEGGRGSTLQSNMVMEDLEFREDFLAGAIQTDGDEYGEGEDEVFVASVDRVTNTASGVIVGSINLGGGDDILRNAGRIEGAVHLGTGDDVLELAQSSIIDGVVDLGEGDDAVLLAFGEGATGVGQVAATLNAELLHVASGSWRAETGNSFYESVAIDAGARLTVAQDNEFVSVATSHIALEGQLALELTSDSEPGELTGLVVEGEGSLHLTGPATLLVDDASGLRHTGGTFVENGELLLTTVYGGDIATSGNGVFVLDEGGDFTGNLVNDGTFVFARAGDYSFLGDFSGSGLLEKRGGGTLAFEGLYAFDGTTTILGGAVIFTGQLAEDTELDLDEGTIDLSDIESGEQTIAQLSGSGGTLNLGATQLIIQQMADTVFAGEILGLGTLVKDGAGDLKLNGDGAGFTGTGQVQGGTLSVNGDYSNANFVVEEGGTLGGAGIVGDTEVFGGTVAPGNSIDTLTVAGDIVFDAASVFEVEVNAAGESDLLQATGTATLGDATVAVIAESGVYAPQTDYTILTAEGGVSGTFGSVEINLAFLDPTLSYSADAVTLRLTRNEVDFAALAQTANQAAIGNLLEGFGFGNALYDETLTLIQQDVAVSFASLTGEVYPAYGGALIETAELLRRQTADSMAGEGAYAWATGLYNNVDTAGAGGIDLVGKGVAGGFGFGGNGFSASAGIGMLDQDRGGADFADGDVTFAIGQVAYRGLGGLSVSAGAQFGWADAEIRRQTTLGTIGGAVSANVDADYVQLFGELAYALPMGGVAVEPFVGVSHVSLDIDGVTETGAATALAVGAIDRAVTFADFGLRLSADAGPVRPFASAAYRRAWGDRESAATVGFAGMPGTALIAGLPIARSAAELSAGLTVSSGAVDFEVGYDGTISNAFDSHGLNAGFRLRF